MVEKSRVLLIHKQQTNLWMKLPTIPSGLAGKIVKYRPLLKAIRMQDLEDFARSPRGGVGGRRPGILGGGVPPGSPNPDPMSDQKM